MGLTRLGLDLPKMEVSVPEGNVNFCEVLCPELPRGLSYQKLVSGGMTPGIPSKPNPPQPRGKMFSNFQFIHIQE